VYCLLSHGLFDDSLNNSDNKRKKTTITRVNNKLGRDVEGSLGEGPVLGSCDHNNEFSGSIKGREHLE
jgi:hypothetical protein